MRALFTIVILVTASVTCTAPPNWKERSILFGPSYTQTKKKMNVSGDVRVLIHSGKAVDLRVDSGYQFRAASKTIKGSGKFTPAEPGELIPHGDRFVFKQKYFRGTLKIYREGENWLYVNHLPVEEYLVSVVGHEMNPQWPLEALKAQAVVARTYVVKRISDHKNEKYDIGSSTSDQVYGGILPNEGNARAAVYKTASQVIVYHGSLATVFFHSCCGGTTAAASEVWQTDFPYLVRKKCEFKESPEYNWQTWVALSTIEKQLGLPKITDIRVGERTASDRVKTLVIKTAQGEKKVSAADFRRVVGPTEIRSTLFDIKMRGTHLGVRGHGYGHGVGLCQWCAKIMVEKQSMKYQTIIRYFFPGTSIGRA